MLKNISNLGKTLSKIEQKEINGGKSTSICQYILDEEAQCPQGKTCCYAGATWMCVPNELCGID